MRGNVREGRKKEKREEGKKEKEEKNGSARRERSGCFELKQRDKFFNESISRDRGTGRGRPFGQIRACFSSEGY